MMAKKSSAKSSSAAMPSPCMEAKSTREQVAEQRKWRAQDALSTITRADEIKRDAALMRDVKAIAQKQVKTLTDIAKLPRGK
jgi:hypothetical protein